jgi:hypothetical protein
VALDCVEGSAWVAHAPDPDEIFDPSVALDEEPPGWIWIEGRLEAADGGVRLCDGLDGPCATSAVVAGIDPATLEPLTGIFHGRVRDGALRDLSILPPVPDAGGDDS